MSVPKVMRAVRVHQFGGPEVMKVETNVPVPRPADTQVLIEVKAAGINPVDTYIRSRGAPIKPLLPWIPGSDVAGIVAGVGSKVTRFKIGDRVFAMEKHVTGGYAEFMVAEENLTGLLVETLTFRQGAAIGIPYYTAYSALCIKGKSNFEKGHTVLVHGASGAVGVACVQIAVSRGIKVLGTAGSKEGLELVKKLGATAVFNHKEEGYDDKILESTDGKGPDLIIEMVASANMKTDLKIINRQGVIVIVGSRGSVRINHRLAEEKECTITDMAILNSIKEEWAEMHAGLAEGLKAGWLVPHIGKEYKLEQAPLAHDELMNNTGALGKRVFVL